METLIIYIAKASLLIALFFMAYYLLLKKETFFNSNRWFLLSGLLTSALLPLFIYTKVIWVDPTPVKVVKAINTSLVTEVIAYVQPVEEALTINWAYIGLTIYIIGVLFFLVRFIVDLFRVKRMLTLANAVKKDGYTLIDSTKILSPFSFFKYIVYNSSLLQPQELESIIAHEKVHSRQWHSADMLISQLFCAAFWFNPVVWLYKKAISQNLEFIADAEATKQVPDKVAYQKTLLKITLQPECIEITNHFYQSLIKKRIIMLNKKESKKSSSLKYVAVLPALAAFVFAFQYKTVAQEKDVALLETAYVKPSVLADTATEELPDVVTMEINKDITDLDFKKNQALFKKVFDADVTFNNVIRNSKGEITSINVTVKDKDHKDNYPVREILGDNSTPITTFTLGIEKTEGKIRNNIFFSEHPLATITLADTSNEDAAVTYLKKHESLKRLIVINGVMQPGSDIIIMEGERISGMTELEANYALKKYGDAAKNGAVELTTVSKTSNNTSDELITTSTGYAISVKDISFTIKKDSKTETLDSYKEAFKAEGIKMIYDGILRNSAGYITSIHIKLTDHTKNTAEGTWEVKGTTDKPIGKIFIGRKKGMLVVLEQK
ncbi:M56 family metallopeptidase [Flavobacterium subsaxonicum]|uniref:M56 family metallopeptidase n=1 Tax=Flavobacterium subsaxonicum TaxID=426226 RepID=UPI0006882F95|nr:M56 family metallopeptidase [Flavobacterium subsaxonicum]